jgi:hypothetical protein
MLKIQIYVSYFGILSCDPQVTLKANTTVVEENSVCNVMAESENGDTMFFFPPRTSCPPPKLHRVTAKKPL